MSHARRLEHGTENSRGLGAKPTRGVGTRRPVAGGARAVGGESATLARDVGAARWRRLERYYVLGGRAGQRTAFTEGPSSDELPSSGIEDIGTNYVPHVRQSSRFRPIKRSHDFSLEFRCRQV